MIRLDNVKVKYKDKVALDLGRVIEIKDGEKVGIIGSNGAGKTTLIKSILGLVPYEGSITLGIPKNKIAVHMQQNEYIDTVPIKIIIEMVSGTSIKSNDKLREMIDFFDFKDCLNKRWKHLSGGQKQRLTLILVMCQNSPISIFDEVTSGLDYETRQRLMDKLIDWYKGKNDTLLISSHYYEELENLATKILYIDKGRVVDYGSKEELFQKYCGKSVVVFKDSPEAVRIAENYNKIKSSVGYTCISCKDTREEESVIKKLIHSNINYRRSDNDIEIMTLNAKGYFKRG